MVLILIIALTLLTLIYAYKSEICIPSVTPTHVHLMPFVLAYKSKICVTFLQIVNLYYIEIYCRKRWQTLILKCLALQLLLLTSTGCTMIANQSSYKSSCVGLTNLLTSAIANLRFAQKRWLCPCFARALNLLTNLFAKRSDGHTSLNLLALALQVQLQIFDLHRSFARRFRLVRPSLLCKSKSTICK